MRSGRDYHLVSLARECTSAARRPSRPEADELRRREPESPSPLVAAQHLEQEARDGVEREEHREDLPVVALARVDDQRRHTAAMASDAADS